MKPETHAALAELNRAFYTRFAGDFARTRQSWPPGFDLILPYLASSFNVLDLGCGNGRLLRFLTEQGWTGYYTGVDSSPTLLTIARENAQVWAARRPEVQAERRAEFVESDLLKLDWAAELRGLMPQAIAALAVLHHIPGAQTRARFIAQGAGLLKPGGVFVVSTWQFLATPRLRAHILPWERIGLTEQDVEPGDYLLSWGQGAAGERYCASIGEDDLRGMADAAGLTTLQTFEADGHEGNLNLYAIFQAGQAANPKPSSG